MTPFIIKEFQSIAAVDFSVSGGLHQLQIDVCSATTYFDH